jgi:D-3-phosphoglycerate dehydrogenase
MSHKVLVATRSFGSTSPKPWHLLETAGYEPVKADMSQPMVEDRLIELLADVEGAIVGVVPFTARVFEHAPALKVVSMHGVGVDHIDVQAATRQDVVVANCPGANGQGVADLAIGLMLALARDIPVIDREMRQRLWKRHQGSELWGKTLGLIGLGYIGQAVAKRAQGFDMQILAYDPYILPEQAQEIGVCMKPLDEIIRAADFLSLHAALNDETRNMIGAAQFEMMKPSAYLVNTGRGGLVDEAAIYHALTERQIAGAALDAFIDEPPWDSPLLDLDNVILTPHIGAHTQESIERVGLIAVQNVIQTLQTGSPLYRVN